MSANERLVLYRGKWSLYSRSEIGSPIRRSLGTSDRAEAERRVADLKALQSLRSTPELRTIAETLFTVLNELPRASATTHLIEWAGSSVQSVKKGIKAVALKINLPFISPHVFRHSAVVWMAEAGISMEEIAQYLGHSNVELTRKVYARFSPSHLRKAAEALEL